MGTPDRENAAKAKEDRENLWTSVLSEVQTDRNSQLPTSKNLLLLGDKESGKTTLIAKIQGNEDPKKGAGLEYHYIDVRDEYRDDHTRLGAWILDGDPNHINLLQFALTETNFTDTTVIFCVSMTTPWNIMDQLQNWSSWLQDHIDKLALSGEKTKELQSENIRRWQDYVEPGDEMESGSPTKRISRNLEMDSSEELLPLPENTLTRNLGLDLIVVVTKTDYMADLERDYDYKEEHFDFIQQSIRKFCLHYGAGLLYTSVKEDKNCDVLYKYLVHRIYNFPFKTPALVVEKDALFIPAGWDNDKKIAILYENMHSVKPDQYYTDVIARPIVRKMGASSRDLEVIAEDEQAFLTRQLNFLQQGAPPATAAGVNPSVQKTPDRKAVGSPGVQGSPKKMEPGKAVGPAGAATSEGVLANFFNSLLTKKQGVAGGSPGSLPAQTRPPGNEDYTAAVVRSDAAAELDRLTRASSRNPNSPNPSGPSSLSAIDANATNNNENNTSINTSSEC